MSDEAGWIPWPASLGFWWHRTRPDGAPHVVEACGSTAELWIYATGNECATYQHERRDGWEFRRAEPPL